MVQTAGGGGGGNGGGGNGDGGGGFGGGDGGGKGTMTVKEYWPLQVCICGVKPSAQPSAIKYIPGCVTVYVTV